MKDVLPPVIEELYRAANEADDALQNPRLRDAINAFCHYRERLEREDLISLRIRSSGDQSVGINKEEIEVRMWRGYIRPDDLLRKEVKELFANAAEALFETSLGDVRFEDECPDCGAILNSKKCPNKDCISK